MRILLPIFFLIFVTELVAQDLAGLSLKDQPALSGSLRLGSNFYAYSGDGLPRNAPLAYSIAGGLNASFAGINVPVSFSLSQQQGSISNPFNQFGASPYYKWAKLHLGHRTLNFSPYVFSGKAFLGAGVELTPGIFRLTAFSGKIQNLFVIQELNDPAGPAVLPSYNRRIQGAKIGLGGKGAGFELMGIKVKDEIGLLPNPEVPASPLENLVFGTKAYLRFLKAFHFETNLSASLFSDDLLAGRPDVVPAAIDNYSFIFEPNISTRLSFAGDASLNYSRKGLTAGLKYRRIEPFYQSFGINFLQNDVENYTANLGLPLLKRKLRFNGSFGLQRDNLRGSKAFQSQRLIGSLSASYSPSQKLNLTLRYANYQHENQSGLLEVNDTLKFVTITQNLFAGGRVQLFENNGAKAALSLNGFRNEVVNESGLSPVNANFTGTGLNANLLFTLKESGWSIGPLFNHNRYDFFNRTQGRSGGGLMLSKSLFKKALHTTVTAQYNRNRLNGENDGTNLNLSLGGNLRLKGGHGLSMRWYYLDNTATVNASFRELRGHIAYTYALNPRRT